jgi:hypothetical protein
MAPVLTILASRPTSAETATDLTQRHIAWRGGASFRSLKLLSQDGRIVTSGLSGSIESWTDRSGRQVTHLELGVLKVAQAIDGEASWRQTGTAPADVMGPQDAEKGREDALVLMASTVENPQCLTIAPESSVDGRLWSVLRVQADGGATQDL